MTTTYPYSTPTIIEFPVKCCKPNKINNGIDNFLKSNSNFSIFYRVYKKSLITLDDDMSYTFFIPNNKMLNCLDIDNMSISTARQIVYSHILKDKIPSELLILNNTSLYSTLNPVNNLLIQKDELNNLYIHNNNKCICIVNKDINIVKGIVHEISDIIIPYLV